MATSIAVTNKALDDNLILGHLSFYTIGESKIDEKTLGDLFVKNNLPNKFIRKISKTDAFRRATSASKSTVNILFNGNNAKAKIEIDEVKNNKTNIVRLLGRKVIDDANEELSYEIVGRIDFDRASCSMYTALDPNKTHLLAEYDYKNILDEMTIRYQEWAVYHTKDTIRNLTVNIINELYPVNIMPSGVAKFIPKTQKDYLFSLQGLIRDLGEHGSGNVFEIIPVIDTNEQRELIDRTAQSDMYAEMKSMVSELNGVIQAKQIIPTGTAKSYIQRYQELTVKATEYEKVIGSYMPIVRAQIKKCLNFIEKNKEDKD